MGLARTEEMKCIVCGDPLILPINKYHACSRHTPLLAQVEYQTKLRSSRKRTKTQKVMNPRRMKVMTGVKEEDELLFM